MKIQICRYIEKYMTWLWSLPSPANVKIILDSQAHVENKNPPLTLEFVILFSTYFTNGFWEINRSTKWN